MTVRSVKVTLNKEYELRFEQDDVEALEDDLKVGYVHFFDTIPLPNDRVTPIYLGLKLLRALIWRGLKIPGKVGPDNAPVYVFPQTSDGKKLAGEMFLEWKKAGGMDIELWKKCREAFADWFGDPAKESSEKIPVGSDPKNSPGDGESPQSH